jgi:hypothetical protein
MVIKLVAELVKPLNKLLASAFRHSAVRAFDRLAGQAHASRQGALAS